MGDSVLFVVFPVEIVLFLVLEFEVLDCVTRKLHSLLLVFQHGFVVNVLNFPFLALRYDLVLFAYLINLCPRRNFGGFILVFPSFLLFLFLTHD